MNPLHESPAGNRLGLLSMASHFSIRLPEKPIELSEPPSPRRSPRHHAAPLSPSKRRGDLEARPALFVDTSGSPPKRSRTETPMNFNAMKILKEHVKIVDGWPHLSHYYSAAPVTTKETSKNVNSPLFLQTCFCEAPIGRVAARQLLNVDPLPETLTIFKSTVHRTKIDLKKFRAFLVE
jgi:hypothetical protein